MQACQPPRVDLPPARWAVNCSLLLTELPLLERPRAARAAGFDAVELWWPFASPVPADREVDALVTAVRDAGVQLVLLNTWGGEMAAGERGVASLPGREAEFRANLDVAAGLAQALACPTLHVLYGRRDGSDVAAQDALAAEHLERAAAVAGSAGAQVVVEALSGVEDYPLRTAADVLRVLDGLAPGLPVRLLCDLYHLTVNGDDPREVVRRHAGRVGHVQVADVPGRHQPGTGTLDLAGCLDALRAADYRGWVGLEYVPLGPSEDSFAWLPRGRRGSGAA